MQGPKFQPWSFWSHRPGVGPGVQIFNSLFQVISLQPLVSSLSLFSCLLLDTCWDRQLTTS